MCMAKIILGLLQWSSPKTHLHITHLHISYLCKYIKDTMEFTQNSFAQNVSRDFLMILFEFVFSRDHLERHVERYNHHHFYLITPKHFLFILDYESFQWPSAHGCCLGWRRDQHLHALTIPQAVLQASLRLRKEEADSKSPLMTNIMFQTIVLCFLFINIDNLF